MECTLSESLVRDLLSGLKRVRHELPQKELSFISQLESDYNPVFGLKPRDELHLLELYYKYVSAAPTKQRYIQ